MSGVRPLSKTAAQFPLRAGLGFGVFVTRRVAPSRFHTVKRMDGVFGELCYPVVAMIPAPRDSIG